VQDAIQAAGGLLPEADAEALNLVEGVQDGQRILVPWQIPKENLAPSQPQSDPGGRFIELPKTDPAQRININTADQAELESLPGIGPVLAQRILAFRAEHGLFTNIQELENVPGIGPAKFDQIKDLVIIAGEQ
jgi:competence protein ComEA